MTETIQLSTPIEHDGRELAEVIVRAPRVKDMKLVDRLDGIDRSIRLMAELTGLSAGSVEKLTVADFERLDAAAARLGKFPGTGRS